MISPAGAVSGRIKGPYVYFIIKHLYLYIGETQQLPVIRWGTHLQNTGTFKKALICKDEDAYWSTTPIFFTSYSCDRILADVPVVGQKRATQWVEHNLHEKACSDVRTYRYDLISNTSRTAPSTIRYPWLSKLSDLVFQEFVSELSKISEVNANGY